jgi:hypothetical protein
MAEIDERVRAHLAPAPAAVAEEDVGADDVPISLD